MLFFRLHYGMKARESKLEAMLLPSPGISSACATAARTAASAIAANYELLVSNTLRSNNDMVLRNGHRDRGVGRYCCMCHGDAHDEVVPINVRKWVCNGHDS